MEYMDTKLMFHTFWAIQIHIILRNKKLLHSHRETFPLCVTWVQTSQNLSKYSRPSTQCESLTRYWYILNFSCTDWLFLTHPTCRPFNRVCIVSSVETVPRKLLGLSFYVTNDCTETIITKTSHCLLSAFKENTKNVYKEITFPQPLITYPISFALKWKCGCRNPLL